MLKQHAGPSLENKQYSFFPAQVNKEVIKTTFTQYGTPDNSVQKAIKYRFFSFFQRFIQQLTNH